MSEVNYLQKAIQYVTDACNEDRRSNYQLAYKLYLISLDYFELSLKFEKDDKRKETIRRRAIEYKKRAEHIKEAFTSNAALAKTNAGSATSQFVSPEKHFIFTVPHTHHNHRKETSDIVSSAGANPQPSKITSSTTGHVEPPKIVKNLDDQLTNLEAHRHHFRHCMFWERLGYCWQRLHDSPKLQGLMEDILMFQTNPESKIVFNLISQKLAGRQRLMELGYQFWNALLMRHPIIFIFFASRMLSALDGDHSQFGLAFRMDGLYGLDWALNRLPKALSAVAESFSDTLKPEIAKMLERLVVQVSALLRIPKDLPLAKMTNSQLDEYQRERDVAAEILSSVVSIGRKLGIPVTLDDDFCDYMVQNINTISIESRSALLIAVKPTTAKVSNFLRVVVDAVVSLLQNWISEARFWTSQLDNSIPTKSDAKNPNTRTRTGSDPENRLDPTASYSYYIREGNEISYRSDVCNVRKIVAIAQILKGLIAIVEVDPAVLNIDFLRPVLWNIINFPLSAGLRCSAAVILSSTVRNDAELCDRLWNAALNGPRPSNTKLDHLLAQEAFVYYVKSDFNASEVEKRPNVSDAIMFDTALSCDDPESYTLQKSMLNAFSPFQFQIGCIPTSVLNGLNLISAAMTNSNMKQEIIIDMLDTLTDFIKCGREKLLSFAPKITAALNRCCELPGCEMAVYSLGLWLGKYLEGKFGNTMENTVLFHLCRDVALRSLHRIIESKQTNFLSLPIYTLVRVCTYGYLAAGDTARSITHGLPKIILEHSPLLTASAGDVIALSTNNNICNLINSISAEEIIQDNLSELILKFHRALVLHPGLADENIVNVIKLKPNIMAYINATNLN